MTNRSPLYLMFRMFCTILVCIYILSFTATLIFGIPLMEFSVALGVAFLLTLWFSLWGSIGVPLLTDYQLRDDPAYQAWRRHGGRPYWDGLQWPINTATESEIYTGLKEPNYTDFVPPPDWRYQCPNCGARVEHQIDVCWNCNYGADGDETAYWERWGDPANWAERWGEPPQADPRPGIPFPEIPPE